MRLQSVIGAQCRPHSDLWPRSPEERRAVLAASEHLRSHDLHNAADSRSHDFVTRAGLADSNIWLCGADGLCVLCLALARAAPARSAGFITPPSLNPGSLLSSKYWGGINATRSWDWGSQAFNN